MVIKNEYTIEELARIANKEKVEIRIDISPEETTIDIEPYDNMRYWQSPTYPSSPYWFTPTCDCDKMTVKVNNG